MQCTSVARTSTVPVAERPGWRLTAVRLRDAAEGPFRADWSAGQA